MAPKAEVAAKAGGKAKDEAAAAKTKDEAAAAKTKDEAAAANPTGGTATSGPAASTSATTTAAKADPKNNASPMSATIPSSEPPKKKVRAFRCDPPEFDLPAEDASTDANRTMRKVIPYDR